MRGSEVVFYADDLDFEEFVSALMQKDSYSFSPTLGLLNCPLTTLNDGSQLKLHRRSAHPEATKVFLLLGKDQLPVTQKIVMHDGTGFKIKADQVLNPDAILFRLGGIIPGNILLPNSMNTTGETLDSRKRFRELKSILRLICKGVDGSLVMEGAMKKLAAGWRLTPDCEFSTDFDLAVKSTR